MTTAVSTDNNQALEATKRTEGFGTVTREKSAELAAIAVASAVKAQVEARYIMAMKNPRNEEDARIKIINTCKNPAFADEAIYSKPVGGKDIEGPSIRFAEEMIRCWKNVHGSQTVIVDEPEKMVFRQIMTDLESNVSYEEDVVIEKSVERQKADESRTILGQRKNSYGKIVYLVAATSDEVFVKKAAHASKSIRTSGLRLIPHHIVEEAMETCRQALKERINKDPEAAKRKVFDAFAVLGIQPSEIEKYLGHPLAQVTPEEIAKLRTIYAALNEGTARWSDYVQPAQQEKAPASVVTMGKGNTAPQQKTAPKAQQTPNNPVSDVPETPQTEQSLKAGVLAVRDAIDKKLGKKKGEEFYFNALGAFGYESLDEIPNNAKRARFLEELTAKAGQI